MQNRPKRHKKRKDRHNLNSFNYFKPQKNVPFPPPDNFV
jgi:hypothetical protein